MDWPHELAGWLPAPRDDEPVDLRRRILAELRDHWQCAVARELVAGASPQQASQRVRERFGDPRRIARRLWFDAMREKIMSQRILIATCVVVSAAAVGAVALAWRLADQSLRASQALAAQSQELNRTLLDKLDLLADQAQQRDAMTWMQVQVKLTLDEPAGQPAAGYTVAFRSADDSASPINVTREAGDDGTVELGRLRAGKYQLRVNTPWDESSFETVLVQEGISPQVFAVTCPAALPGEAQVQLEVNWPEDLRDAGVALYAEFALAARSIDGKSWQFGHGHTYRTKFCINPAGEQLDYELTDKSMINSPLNFPAFVHMRETPVVATAGRPFRVAVGAHALRRALVVLPQVRLDDGKYASRLVSCGLVAQDAREHFSARPNSVTIWRIEISDSDLILVRRAMRSFQRPATGPTPSSPKDK